MGAGVQEVAAEQHVHALEATELLARDDLGDAPPRGIGAAHVVDDDGDAGAIGERRAVESASAIEQATAFSSHSPRAPASIAARAISTRSGRVGADRHEIGPLAREQLAIVGVEMFGGDLPVGAEVGEPLGIGVGAGDERHAADAPHTSRRGCAASTAAHHARAATRCVRFR